MTISQGKQLRKEGYNIVTNRRMTKVLRHSKQELSQGKNELLFKALVKVVVTKKQADEAWELHRKINKI